MVVIGMMFGSRKCIGESFFFLSSARSLFLPLSGTLGVSGSNSFFFFGFARSRSRYCTVQRYGVTSFIAYHHHHGSLIATHHHHRSSSSLSSSYPISIQVSPHPPLPSPPLGGVGAVALVGQLDRYSVECSLNRIPM